MWQCSPWLNRVALVLCSFAFAILAIASSNSEAQSPNTRTLPLVCTISGLFSFDGATVVNRSVIAEGRGLLSCRNDNGFATDYAIHGQLKMYVPEAVRDKGDIVISAESRAFVIPREIGQIQDFYHVRLSPHALTANSFEPNLLFRGSRQDLAIEMKLTLHDPIMSEFDFRGLDLRFDDTAPDFF